MSEHLPKLSTRLLEPYVSFVVFVQRGKMVSCDVVCRAIRDYIATDDRSKITAEGLNKVPSGLPATTQLQLVLSFVSHRRPPWGGLTTDPADPERSDRYNHLVIVLECGELIAVYSSDDRIKQHLLRKQSKLELGGVGLLTRPALEEALLRGEVATFWMGEGSARRGRRGPKSKITFGDHLEDTLDSVGDQSHTLAGARATATEEILGEGRQGVIGVNLEKSGFWLGPSADLLTFVSVSDSILNRIRNVLASGGGHERFVIFARYIDDIDAVERVYDIDFANPGAQPGVTPSPETVAAFDWIGTRLVSVEASGRRTARVTLAGSADTEAILTIKPERVRRGSIEFSMARVDGDERLGNECLGHLRLLEPRLYYESGHTVTDNGIVAESFIDTAFGGWVFDPLAGVDISKEKPGNGTRQAIADTAGTDSDPSLFGWIVRAHTSGWLYCDDGSDELCDFIHFDDVDGHLRVWHVKACKAGSRRSIAAVPYEDVCAQVVKNMPSLSVPRLVAELEERQRLGEARPMWRGGRPSTDVAGMIEALRQPRANLRVTACVLQPHVTEKALMLGRARSGTGLHGDHQRLRRLEHLLITTDDAVARLGAHLEVVTATG